MSKMKIIPLGGMGAVTQNMYLYQYEKEILIVDCGIGFPDVQMYGVDIVLPDISYLLEQLEAGANIAGMVLSHGHDDHIAATGYLLGQLPEFPIYASPLTAGFARQRMEDGGVLRPVQVLRDKQPVKIGQHFELFSIAITHSVPDTKHLVIGTPEGIIYHGTDFKLDPKPVDGVKSDLAAIEAVGKEGVLLALMDCLRVEKEETVGSESSVGPVIAKLMAETKGKCLVTMMSSHIHRIQQTVDAAVEQGRKVAFVGRSIQQNVEIALSLNKLRIPEGSMIDPRELSDYDDTELCVMVAGSQGQEGSSMVRAVLGEHRDVTIHSDDTVIFSAEAIPGNEVPYYRAIDQLAAAGVTVYYPDLVPGLHQSGHASATEQRELLSLLKPQLVMPIGGADRHRVLFVERVAEKVGMKAAQVLRPETGEVIAFDKSGQVDLSEQVSINPTTVDGLGVGDVGPMVLSDRKALSEAGMVVVVIPRRNRKLQPERTAIVSRGFVFMKEADEVLDYIKQRVTEIVDDIGRKAKDHEVQRALERRLGRSLYKIIRREPIILTAVVEG